MSIFVPSFLILCDAVKKPRIRKDPTAATDFLPDPERDARKLKEIEEKLYKEQQQQELQKAQLIEVPVNYYDGNDHRRIIQVRPVDIMHK